MKALFYGTPEVAVPFLDLTAQKCSVAAVVCQPDKPAGRGLSLSAPPVKLRAVELGLPVLQPQKPSEIASELAALQADVAVCVAYGRLLKKDVLAAPKHGTLNVHFSLLPKYRGAAPVQWSLVRGERKTGVTVFWLDEGMDTGPIFTRRETDVDPNEDAGALMARLQKLGLEALAEALGELAAGRKRAEPQQGEPSLAPLIRREDAEITTFDRPAEELHNLVRGFRLWPRASLDAGSRVLVLKTRLAGPHDPPGKGQPGLVLSVDRDGGILIECQSRSRLWFLAVQPEGKKPVSAGDFLNGLRKRAGDLLSIRAK